MTDSAQNAASCRCKNPGVLGHNSDCPEYPYRTPSAANEPDVTEDTVVPGRFRCAFEATYEVECEFDYEKGVSFALLHQAIQDALGYTGVVVDDVTEYEEIP
jgi:hypothetical protein